MAYKLERFGSVELPELNPATARGTGRARTDLIRLPGGGMFDPLGTSRAPLDATSITHDAVLTGTSATDLETQFYALRALIGKRDKLWRRRLATGAVEWIYARLTDVGQTSGVDQINWLPIVMEFEKISPIWYGHEHPGPWTLDSGESLDTGLYLDEAANTTTLTSSPQAIAVTNGGHAVVTNATITVTAGSANITSLLIETGNASIQYNATITAGQSLVINCGAKSVKKANTSDYANFALTASHTEEEWFPLQPGANTVTVTWGGGGGDSTITIAFSDGWF